MHWWTRAGSFCRRLPVGVALVLPGPAMAQEAIVDTARPFAPGAVQREQELRGPLGWPSYQEGRAGGMTYRFDPDGYARFSFDERRPDEAWAVTCTAWPERRCRAENGALLAELGADGALRLEVTGMPPDARFRPAGMEAPAATLGEIARRMPAVGPGATDLLPEHGGPPVPWAGLPTVLRYMRWVLEGGPPAAEAGHAGDQAVSPAPVPPVPVPPTPAPLVPAPPVPAPIAAPPPVLAQPPISPAEAPVVPMPVRKPRAPDRSLRPGGAELPVTLAALVRETPPAPAAGPSCPVPPAGPDRPLGDAIDSLRGIEAVAVFTDYLAEPEALKGRLRRQVQERVEERLRSVGLRVLSKEELEKEPGRPRLEFYLSRSAPGTDCPFRASISLRQEVLLGRDGGTALHGGTWSVAGPSRLSTGEGAELESLAFYLESFITDWRTANSGVPRTPRTARPKAPEPSLGQWIGRALSITLGTGIPLREAGNLISNSSTLVGPDREPPGTPTLSTTFGLNWPGMPWFGRLTLYHYLDQDEQRPWNPDFAYAFGYDDYRPNTFSLTYGNYGGNRFDPGHGERFSKVEEGSIRAAYKLSVEDRLLAPLFTEETRLLSCQPAVTTTPRYFDQASNDRRAFKTSLSFGCRYPIWRSLFIGGTVFFYPDASQQQDWDPDYSYSFGWSNWRPGTFSVEYSNSSGNRWPWRDGGGGSFLEGSISLSYRVPLESIVDWFASP